MGSAGSARTLRDRTELLRVSYGRRRRPRGHDTWSLDGHSIGQLCKRGRWAFYGVSVPDGPCLKILFCCGVFIIIKE